MKTLAASIAAAGLVLAAAAPALADTIRVPEDYLTIGEAVLNAQDSDVILVGKGTYAEEVIIDSKSNLTIRGKGKPLLTPAGVAFTLTTCSVVEITGFRVETGAGAVDATGCSGLTVSKIEVVAPSNTSFNFTGCADVLLSKCTVTDASTIVVQDFSSSGLVIEKCAFSVAGGSNVLEISPLAGGSNGSNGAVIEKNRLTGGGTAICFGGTSARIEKNTIFGPSSAGILFEGTTDVSGTVVSKNRIETQGAVGIQSMDNNVTLERNLLVAASITSQGDGVVIDRNVLTSPPGIGIYCFGTGTTVTNNQVRNAEGVGILVSGGIAVVERNKVFEADNVGIYLSSGTANSLLRFNQVKACDAIGIVVYATPITVTGNKSSLNGLQDYADSNAEGVNVLTDNKFGTTLFNFVE